MDREFSAPLHHTQFGNHIAYKQKVSQHLNPEVAELVEKGYNIRTAYRIVNNRNRKQARTKSTEFDYEAETPKGEWVWLTSTRNTANTRPVRFADLKSIAILTETSTSVSHAHTATLQRQAGRRNDWTQTLATEPQRTIKRIDFGPPQKHIAAIRHST